MFKKYLTGLLMAWGNFFFIPCPVKKWDNEAKNYMLAWVPFIGFIMGLLWMGASLLLFRLSLPIYLTGFVITFIPFLLSGFIHVDGFMDVCDALGSWGDTEKKQKILKDSLVGSGAVIRMIFYTLCYYAMIMTAFSKLVFLPNLIFILVVPRFVSTLFVMRSRKIGEVEGATIKSQYVGLKRDGLIFMVISFVIILAIVFLTMSFRLQSLMVIGGAALGSLVSVLVAKKKLGGMNGDIAGFGILWGELLGVITLALI